MKTIVTKADRESLQNQFRKYEVTATSLEDFMDRYMKDSRYKGRNDALWGYDYSEHVLASSKEYLDLYGVCIISHFDSRTGEIVSYYQPK